MYIDSLLQHIGPFSSVERQSKESEKPRNKDKSIRHSLAEGLDLVDCNEDS